MPAPARRVVVTPFTLSGAMSPVTIAGALAQQNAEALAVIALAQTINPGTPVIYGGFTSNVDMRTGAPAFGTPDMPRPCWPAPSWRAAIGLPFRSSNVNASNAVDVQAAYESAMSLWACFSGQRQPAATRPPAGSRAASPPRSRS